MKTVLFFLALVVLSTSACSPKPQAIDYGNDECDFCRMTIVDNQHAAELVTTKGKPFKFDAIECMVQYTHQHRDEEYAFILVNDYLEPGALIDAKSSSFLISRNIPSPMGAFLTAFSSKEQALEMQQKKEGQIYTWESLSKHLMHY